MLADECGSQGEWSGVDVVGLIRYLTHPQVSIDPDVPVPLWGLNAVGHERVRQLAEAGWLNGTTQIISSAERKAVETAVPIAAALGINLEVRKAMHENDRSATGYLPQPEFENAATEFFSHPAASFRGWERAIDAQARIIGEVEAVLSRHIAGDILFVGHGGVGTLLFCHVAKVEIGRAYDQAGGGGQYFTFTREAGIIHSWRPMERSSAIPNFG
jgi:broad specificity phosphatase PhoE